MAKLLGVIRYGGKLGQTVGYRSANGKRLVRARVDEISNPRSTGQNIQRMVFSTAAVSLGHLSEVLRSSVEGVKAGAPSLAYLRGKALNMLRTSDIMQGNAYRYALKGKSDFVVNPYQISKGSLAPVAIGDFTTGSDNGLHLGIKADSGDTMEAKTFSKVFPNVALGDQLTFIQIAQEIGTLRPSVFYCRIAAKTNDLPFFVPMTAGGVNYWVINEAVLDLTKCAGNWRSMEFTLIDSEVVVSPGLQPAAFESDLDYAYGIIVSNRETGKRSTSFLKLASDIAGIFPWNADIAAPTYGNSSTPVDVAFDEYCDNSTNVSVEQTVVNIELDKVKITGDEEDVPVQAVGGVYTLPAASTIIFKFNQELKPGKFTLEVDAGSEGISMNAPIGDEVAVVTSANAAGSFHFKFMEPAAVLGFSKIG